MSFSLSDAECRVTSGSHVGSKLSLMRKRSCSLQLLISVQTSVLKVCVSKKVLRSPLRRVKEDPANVLSTFHGSCCHPLFSPAQTTVIYRLVLSHERIRKHAAHSHCTITLALVIPEFRLRLHSSLIFGPVFCPTLRRMLRVTLFHRFAMAGQTKHWLALIALDICRKLRV